MWKINNICISKTVHTAKLSSVSGKHQEIMNSSASVSLKSQLLCLLEHNLSFPIYKSGIEMHTSLQNRKILFLPLHFLPVCNKMWTTFVILFKMVLKMFIGVLRAQIWSDKCYLPFEIYWTERLVQQFCTEMGVSLVQWHWKILSWMKYYTVENLCSNYYFKRNT